jgi:peptide/nickel transport system permease protein
MISVGIVSILGLAIALADVVAPYDPNTQDLQSVLQSPSADHWFGTDQLGRDVFSRVLHGGRVSVLVGLTVAISSGLVGGIVGSLAGYFGGWLDALLMRITDLFLSMPVLVVLIVASASLGGTVGDIIVVLTMFFWMNGARIVRGVFLSLKEKEFVEAARCSGLSDFRIIASHLFPNAVGPITISVTLSVAISILAESALSFLGFGVQLPTATWGNLLNEAQTFTLSHPWLVWPPGIAILLTVLAVNFLGDGLRDALDPYDTTPL